MRLNGDIMVEETVVSRTCVELSRTSDAVAYSQQVSKKLRETLERSVASGTYGANARVEVYTDGPYAMLFWYLVLHRPWGVGVIPPGFFEGNPKCVAEALGNNVDSGQMRLTNLGVFYDQEKNWLVLSLPRAQQSGLLTGWERCPAWVKLAKRLNDQKLVKDAILNHDEYQLAMARYSSFVVPHSTLHACGYIKKLSVFQGTGELSLKYEDLVVLDCAALPIIEADVTANHWADSSALPPALDLYVVRFIPADPKAAQELRKNTRALRRQELHDRARAKRLETGERENKTRLRDKPDWVLKEASWHQRASGIIQQLFKAYNLKRGIIGRTRKCLNSAEVRMSYEELLSAFQRAEVKQGFQAGVKTTQVEILLRGLRECLDKEPTLPVEYALWLNLEDMSLADAAQAYGTQ